MSRSGAEVSQGEAGFGLLEILVVLALVGVLSATIMMAISQFRPLLKLDKSVESRLALQLTARHVAALLEQAESLPLAGASEGQAVRQMLQGGKSEVRFIATVRRGATQQGLREVVLHLAQTRFIQTMTPRRLGAMSDGREDVELTNDVLAISFSYYGEQDAGQSPTWQDRWSGAALPLAISVHLQARKDGTEISASEIASFRP